MDGEFIITTPFQLKSLIVEAVSTALKNQPPAARPPGLANESNEPDIITIEQATKLVKLAKSTMYGLVNRNEIPYMKGPKLLYFSRKELEAWIRKGRNKTVAESAADVYADLKQQAR